MVGEQRAAPGTPGAEVTAEGVDGGAGGSAGRTSERRKIAQAGAWAAHNLDTIGGV